MLMTRIISSNDSEIVDALELLLNDSKKYIRVYGDIKTSPGELLHEAWLVYPITSPLRPTHLGAVIDVRK